MKVVIDIKEETYDLIRETIAFWRSDERYTVAPVGWQEIADSKPYEEKSQGGLTADETRLIGEAVNYLLGADLVEENGWSENDIKVLQSLCERYYVEDSEEENE